MSQNLFTSVQGLRPKKNGFNLSFKRSFTGDFGYLMPCYIQHCVPGGVYKTNVASVARFQALLAPLMDSVYQYVHFWAIPYRLLDKNFTRWLGGEMEDSDYNPPYLQGDLFAAEMLDQFGFTSVDDFFAPGTLLNFLGYPSTFYNDTSTKVNIRPLAAYALVLKDWYINEHLSYEYSYGSDTFKLVDVIENLLDAEGDASAEVAQFIFVLYNMAGSNTKCFFPHAWAQDYFTSALPNVQEGNPVTLPIAGTASVTIPHGAANNIVNIGSPKIIGTYASEGYNIEVGAADGNAFRLGYNDGTNVYSTNSLYGALNMSLTGSADLSSATAVTINELRVANALQVFRERLMRFGHRYVEYLKGFFNVTSSDARLQLPHFLGGGKIPVNIAEVVQQSASQTSPASPLGQLAGKATGFGSFVGFKKPYYAEEETIIIGLTFFVPKASYSQGLDRFLTKLNDRYDYFNPTFEHLGEQTIKLNELYYQVGNTADFGYTPRFAEYRFHNDEVRGQFQSTLNYWTCGRIFSSAPSLNASFAHMLPAEVSRIFATTGNTDHLQIEMYFDNKALQPISKFGTPMLLN